MVADGSEHKPRKGHSVSGSCRRIGYAPQLKELSFDGAKRAVFAAYAEATTNLNHDQKRVLAMELSKAFQAVADV